MLSQNQPIVNYARGGHQADVGQLLEVRDEDEEDQAIIPDEME